MTIKARLWLLVAVSVFASATLFLIAKIALSYVEQDFTVVADDRIPKILEVDQLLIRNVETQRDVREYILLKDADRRLVVEKRIEENRGLNQKAYQWLEDNIRSEQGKALLAKAIEGRKPLSDANNKALA